MGMIFPEFFINYLRKITVATFSIVGDCLQFNIYIMIWKTLQDFIQIGNPVAGIVDNHMTEFTVINGP